MLLVARRLMNRRTIRAALLAFLLSRAAFFALVVVGSNVAFLRKVYNDRVWETSVVLQREHHLVAMEVRRCVLDHALRRAIDRPAM